MAALNMGFLWLIVSGTVASVVGHFTTEEVGGWVGSLLFFGGIALMIGSWFAAGSSSKGGLADDVPVHQDVLGPESADG